MNHPLSVERTVAMRLLNDQGYSPEQLATLFNLPLSAVSQVLVPGPKYETDVEAIGNAMFTRTKRGWI